MLERMRNSLRNMVRSWLRLQPATINQYTINELLTFDGNCQVNRIWYRGEAYELKQLYEQIPDEKFSFWGAPMTPGLEIRKIHTGLPSLIVDQLANLTISDIEKIKFEGQPNEDIWEKMFKGKAFKDTIKSAIIKCLVFGDGAFKININSKISPYPILEFYEADRVELKKVCGAITEIVFKSVKHDKFSTYILKEHYGMGYVSYELFDNTGNAVPLKTVPECAELCNVEFSNKFMLAEYMRFFDSNKWEGRGRSIFDNKRDNFDAFDECWSQWMDALRAGRTHTYIPEDLLPRDIKTGQVLRGNSFDNRFIKVAAAAQEDATSKIDVEQGTIPHDSYLATYITALDLCLQGIISPSTLGIDTKKIDNAEAQREKEKTTLYTRQTIVTTLQTVLPNVIKAIFFAYQTMNNQALEDVKVEVPFGEYANPSFESQVETVSKAKQGGIMSIEAAVEELYGDTMDREWKANEVKRIKQESGIIELPEPALNDNKL